VYAGADAARLIGVDPIDPRVPDVIGLAQYGVVYTGGKGKIAEHGGDHLEDRNVQDGIYPDGLFSKHRPVSS
jgi:hypothetical protein